MTRQKWIWFLFLAIPFFSSGCYEMNESAKDVSAREWIKGDDGLYEWLNETVHPALEMLCDMERLIYQGVLQEDGTYEPFVEHLQPIPDEVVRFCSIPGSGDPPAPPPPPETWD